MSKIVVGIDGSEESARALDWAVEEAQLRGLRLEVVAYDHQRMASIRPPPTLEALNLEDIERSRARPGVRHPRCRPGARRSAPQVNADRGRRKEG